MTLPDPPGCVVCAHPFLTIGNVSGCPFPVMLCPMHYEELEAYPWKPRSEPVGSRRHSR